MRRFLPAFGLIATLVIAACSGGATPGPDGTPGATGDPVGQPTDAATDAAATAGPTSGAFQSLTPGDILAGQWTSGSVKVELRDGYNDEFELDLNPGSFTAEGASYLTYGVGDPWVVQVVFGGDTGDGFVMTGPMTSGGGTDDGNCTFEITRSDSSVLEARVECTDTGAIEGATIHESQDVKLTLSARR